ncbi:MAG: cupin domain-containing protein [Gemmatimonadota bacterium]|nr:MAG: cupin domain-containing protein [Gemmatimonadota bacterium]
MSDADRSSRADLRTRPMAMADLVEYQAGSVVSRRLLKHRSGTMTVFAFDRGQGLSEHTAPFEAVVHVLEGEAEITLCGSPFRLNGGEMILIPADVAHAVRAVERFKMVLTLARD